MKPGIGNLAFGLLAGFAVQRLMSQKSELAEPTVPDRFAPQPMAIYIERVVWALTPDHDIRSIRDVRNFINDNSVALSELYRMQIPADKAAQEVERMMTRPEPLGEVVAIAAPVGT